MNPNKLAWKGTPGPWIVARGWRGNVDAYRVISGADYNVVLCDSFIFPRVTNEANAHLISAAPEAVEFVADMLEYFDTIAGITPEISALISRGEEIIKKAYNF